MLLILILKILFCFLLIRHTIKWVSYHFHHRNKKTRIFHGNTRMPFDVAFALAYGFFPKRKKRVKDLSYCKSLAEWKELLDTIYPPDSELNFPSYIQTNLKFPASATPIKSEGDLFANRANPSPKVDWRVSSGGG